MNAYFAYTRVSTAKQGEGVSLQAQREAIERHAQRHGLQIQEWFEEKETAAKRGRPVFSRMLLALKRGKMCGVIIHKIDRSARNLKDWADLGDLIDAGIQVHFANESLDLNTRGGRLSADIQAVVAADYIRNLREETRKGFYGRLKQGVYPLPAPVGYLNKGKGIPKELDPGMGLLVAKAFELYATGEYSLETLVEEMYKRGLRNRRGDKVTRNGMSTLLNNPFYMGLIRLHRTGEVFPGSHRPLITKATFDRVQRLLDGKTTSREWRHEFLFRRILTCRYCQRPLTGEIQKGHTYYRCHSKGCITKTVREEHVESVFVDSLKRITLTDADAEYLLRKSESFIAQAREQSQEERQGCELRLHGIGAKIGRLTDAYLDGAIDRELFEERKHALLAERKDAEERIATLTVEEGEVAERLQGFFELAKSAYLSYKKALPKEKRELVQILTSNRWVEGKNVVFELSLPFQVLADQSNFSNGAPSRDEVRTWDKLVQSLMNHSPKRRQVEIRTG